MTARGFHAREAGKRIWPAAQLASPDDDCCKPAKRAKERSPERELWDAGTPLGGPSPRNGQKNVAHSVSCGTGHRSGAQAREADKRT